MERECIHYFYLFLRFDRINITVGNMIAVFGVVNKILQIITLILMKINQNIILNS